MLYCFLSKSKSSTISLLQISFDFTNIGSVLGAAVSLIGSFAIDFGRGLIVDGVKKVFNNFSCLFQISFFQIVQEGFQFVSHSMLPAGDYGATPEPAVRR